MVPLPDTLALLNGLVDLELLEGLPLGETAAIVPAAVQCTETLADGIVEEPALTVCPSLAEPLDTLDPVAGLPDPLAGVTTQLPAVEPLLDVAPSGDITQEPLPGGLPVLRPLA
jgi:hypothetical protein